MKHSPSGRLLISSLLTATLFIIELCLAISISVVSDEEREFFSTIYHTLWPSSIVGLAILVSIGALLSVALVWLEYGSQTAPTSSTSPQILPPDPRRRTIIALCAGIVGLLCLATTWLTVAALFFSV